MRKKVSVLELKLTLNSKVLPKLQSNQSDTTNQQLSVIELCTCDQKSELISLYLVPNLLSKLLYQKNKI